eukprot:463620-Rhodomonas_salina.1
MVARVRDARGGIVLRSAKQESAEARSMDAGRRKRSRGGATWLAFSALTIVTTVARSETMNLCSSTQSYEE